MELELKELRSSLLDEKHYSSELKKELDRLSAIIAKQNKVAEGEMPYLLQQVQMLEAGKALVTQRLLETEKELNAATRLIESSRVEKDGIVTKLGEVSAKVTKLTEEIEDKQAEKTLLGDELVRYRKEINVNYLNLLLRPSEDDVRVLRQELVHAQQLMNKMTLEKEEEIAEHLATICHLNKDNQQYIQFLFDRSLEICHENFIRVKMSKVLQNLASCKNYAFQIAEEDDVNLAMKRMQEENTKLKDYIKEMNILNKQLKEDNEELANKEQFSEKLALEKEKLRTVGETSNKARHKYAVAEDDVNNKFRCLKSESDLDFERDRAAENKRRFDDAISAMHDLGRANQSLQMDISKHFNRKWLDDSEAVNCNLCTKLFSLTVRKHHCRHCGLIFCGNCTQHTAEVPSHKNPVRVCSICYEEITNR
ncbi:unnamed protein product [Dracunculus medinensis]|uniref:FYVE-type domain-containing protein n=1 Tax=Dracunculus medinensis TaxID=318479 RepID=A0A0N4UH85_DRAME|nr:unnamed protein product [Dracunculus medinensis]